MGTELGNPVALHLAPEGGAIHPQSTGGFGTVATMAPQSSTNHIGFDGPDVGGGFIAGPG